ncbi:MAG TPA: zf-TFIIB domain-containing protein [Patescibacteria group bacterium]|jgi:Zn-finger nucleic acid-binding protein|nr:zf-TFIIB domain-containing protein [Patescibacteria group bacterium]
MKCPACFNELTQTQVGSLVVDVCQGGCGGVWFDAFELQRVDEEDELAGERLLQIKRDERIVVDTSRKRDCPRCAGMRLHRHFFSARRQVEVDQCPNCGGYWLDPGELAQIREEKAKAAQIDELRNTTLSGADIRYLYRLSESRKRSG